MVILPVRPSYSNAAIKLRKKVRKLAIYEAPYALGGAAIKAAKAYDRQLKKLLASGRNGDAVALFVRNVGVSDKQIQAMKQHAYVARIGSHGPDLSV